MVVAIIAADIAFAVDSIPAARRHSRPGRHLDRERRRAPRARLPARAGRDPRARFRYLGKTIALILAFVGIKILAADLVHISDLGSLAVIVFLLAGGVIASLVAD